MDLTLLLGKTPPVKKAIHFAIAHGAHLLPFPDRVLAQGAGSVVKIAPFLKRLHKKKVFIVTDANLVSLGHVKTLTDSLEQAGLPYAVYDGTVPNPTVQNCEDAYALYAKEGCDCVIGLGGGSPMDVAKVVAARAVRPNRTTTQMGNLFMVTLPNVLWILKKPRRYPMVITVPTTAGTGAEYTYSSVISDPDTDRKYTVNDTALLPDRVVLDPALTLTLDPRETALTAIDALSHCTEAYVGHGHNKRSDDYSRKGIKLIFENIDRAVQDPGSIDARSNLLHASHYGGLVLITGYTTYVHPFAHKIGAMYHLVHGRCIGAVMPPVLEFFRPEADARLAELADLIGVSSFEMSTAEKAEAYIDALRALSQKYGVDPVIPELKRSDFKEIAKAVHREALFYPVPKLMKDRDVYRILEELTGKTD